VYDIVEQTQDGNSSFFGGTNFANNLWDSRGEFAWGVHCENIWNYKAWCKINVVGGLVNPLIKNITNWQQYKINWTTNNLLLDSKDWWSVTDNWEDISNKRDYGTAIMLSPGINEIWIFADSWEAVFTVSWFSAWDTI
jgi:hypothetical protein